MEDSWIGSIFTRELTVPGALLLIVVWVVFAILTDRLVAGKRLKAEQEATEKWQNAYDTLSKAHSQVVKQLDMFMYEARVQIPFMQAFGEVSRRMEAGETHEEADQK